MNRETPVPNGYMDFTDFVPFDNHIPADWLVAEKEFPIEFGLAELKQYLKETTWHDARVSHAKVKLLFDQYGRLQDNVGLPFVFTFSFNESIYDGPKFVDVKRIGVVGFRGIDTPKGALVWMSLWIDPASRTIRLATIVGQYEALCQRIGELSQQAASHISPLLLPELPQAVKPVEETEDEMVFRRFWYDGVTYKKLFEETGIPYETLRTKVYRQADKLNVRGKARGTPPDVSESQPAT